MNTTDLQNELESRRADSAQLERMVNLINAALPDFKSVMGNEADHAELALQALINQHSALAAVRGGKAGQS
jgi:hypothetical protein